MDLEDSISPTASVTICMVSPTFSFLEVSKSKVKAAKWLSVTMQAISFFDFVAQVSKDGQVRLIQLAGCSGLTHLKRTQFIFNRPVFANDF